MSSILLVPRAAEPLPLADAKAYLRVAHADDDDLITALVANARTHVEAQTRRALITQTWRHARDAWPGDGRIAVLPAPLQSLAAARVYDADGNAHAIDPQTFVVDTIAATGIVTFLPGQEPGVGAAVTAGFLFDVPVRLDTDYLEVDLSAFAAGAIPAIPLVEIVP